MILLSRQTTLISHIRTERAMARTDKHCASPLGTRMRQWPTLIVWSGDALASYDPVTTKITTTTTHRNHHNHHNRDHNHKDTTTITTMTEERKKERERGRFEREVIRSNLEVIVSNEREVVSRWWSFRERDIDRKKKQTDKQQIPKHADDANLSMVKLNGRITQQSLGGGCGRWRRSRIGGGSGGGERRRGGWRNTRCGGRRRDGERRQRGSGRGGCRRRKKRRGWVWRLRISLIALHRRKKMR